MLAFDLTIWVTACIAIVAACAAACAVSLLLWVTVDFIARYITRG